MAKVRQCDRCGEIFKGKPTECAHHIHLYFEHTDIDLSKLRNEVDLCDQCVEEFNDWYIGVDAQ